MASCIPSNPDISGIGVRTAIYAQNFLSFAPVVVHLWDQKVTSDEVKSMEGQSVGILSVAFAILISTILEANAKTASAGQLISSFHAAVILDLSWMNNTSTFIWFLLYAHHRSKTDNKGEPIAATWSAWIKVLLSPLCQVKEVEAGRTDSRRQSVDIAKKNKHKVARLDIIYTSKIPPWSIRRSWDLVSQAPVLTLGSLHLSLMAVIGIWLWSDPGKFGAPITCDPSLTIVGGAVRFSSPTIRICSLLIYSLLLIPGFNLAVPFLIFLAPHILYNGSRRRHPQFWERCRHILNTIWHNVKSLRHILHAPRRISATIRGLQTLSDPEAQASSNHHPTASSVQSGQSLSPSAAVHTASLVGGLVCLLAINIIFLVDIELTLSRNKSNQSQGEGVWGFGQVLALLLLVVPFRDFVSSISEIRQRLMEEKRSREMVHKKFEESLRGAIEKETFEGYDFQALIEQGADPNTQIKGKISYY